VQDVHGVSQARDVNHAVGAGVAPDPQFLDALANVRHRLEIVRLQTPLQAVDLKSGVTTGIIGKPSKNLQRRRGT
jgi:hypothetical protein